MRIRFASATGDPYGQFIVEAESQLDKELIENFLKGLYDEKFKFWLHGTTYTCGGYTSFNFGWTKGIQKNFTQKVLAKIRRS
jgi:hypothetical protein